MQRFSIFPLRRHDVVLVIVLLLVVLLAMWIYKEDTNPDPSPGTPVQYEEKLNINKISIDRVANDSERLYLLDDNAGILRIFDLAGNYQNTISFFDYNNGSFFLATRNDQLYVEDPRGDVYFLTDGTFNQFIRRTEAQDVCKGLDFENNPSQYEVRRASVWRVSEEGDTCVIERPLTYLQYQSNIALPVTVGIVMLFRRILFFKKIKDR